MCFWVGVSKRDKHTKVARQREREMYCISPCCTCWTWQGVGQAPSSDPLVSFTGLKPTCPGRARHNGLISTGLLHGSVLIVTVLCCWLYSVAKAMDKMHVKLHTNTLVFTPRWVPVVPYWMSMSLKREHSCTLLVQLRHLLTQYISLMFRTVQPSISAWILLELLPFWRSWAPFRRTCMIRTACASFT